MAGPGAMQAAAATRGQPTSGVRPPAGAPKPGTVGAPAAPRSSGSGVTNAGAASNPPADALGLAKLAEDLKKKTHFEVLGVDRTADAAAIKAAYFKLARSYHPDTIPADAPAGVAKAKADIFARIGDAHRVLADNFLRQEYQAELDAGGTGEKVDVAKILAGEELFQRGMILVKARKFPDAVKTLDEAIAANPTEPEYYAWRGYARFFGFADKKAAQGEVLKEIDKCIRENPRVAAAYYFKGFILKTNGDLKSARACFKDCVDRDPGHIDAQRELRMSGK